MTINSVSPPSHVTKWTPQAQKLTEFIMKRPTPEALSAFIAAMPKFSFDQGDVQGVPALCRVCQYGYDELIPVLVNGRQWLVNYADKNGWTAAHYAALNFEIRAMDALVVRGGDLSSRSLHVVHYRRLAIEDSDFGITAEEPVDAYPSGATPLWVACRRAYFYQDKRDPYIHFRVHLLKYGSHVLNRGIVFPISKKAAQAFKASFKVFEKEKRNFNSRIAHLYHLRSEKDSWIRVLPLELFEELQKCLYSQYLRKEYDQLTRPEVKPVNSQLKYLHGLNSD